MGSKTSKVQPERQGGRGQKPWLAAYGDLWKRIKKEIPEDGHMASFHARQLGAHLMRAAFEKDHEKLANFLREYRENHARDPRMFRMNDYIKITAMVADKVDKQSQEIIQNNLSAYCLPAVSPAEPPVAEGAVAGGAVAGYNVVRVGKRKADIVNRIRNSYRNAAVPWSLFARLAVGDDQAPQSQYPQLTAAEPQLPPAPRYPTVSTPPFSSLAYAHSLPEEEYPDLRVRLGGVPVAEWEREGHHPLPVDVLPEHGRGMCYSGA